MTEASQQAAEFLENVFDQTGLELSVAVKQGIAGEVLDIEGEDAELLQAQTGELLEALQHLVNQVFGRSLAAGERLVCDVNGFRATREAELQAMANLAASRVRQTGMPFTFQPMSANEHRPTSSHIVRSCRVLSLMISPSIEAVNSERKAK